MNRTIWWNTLVGLGLVMAIPAAELGCSDSNSGQGSGSGADNGGGSQTGEGDSDGSGSSADGSAGSDGSGSGSADGDDSGSADSGSGSADSGQDSGSDSADSGSDDSGSEEGDSGEDSGDDGGDGDLDFDNNHFPSPMPPGNLAAQDAPQIIVFGWDDCMFTGDHANDLANGDDNGMNYVHKTFGPLTNPDGSDVHISFYENGAYLPNTETGGPWGSETDLTLAAGKELLAEGFELGNHTFDHMEINSTWGQIPEKWKTGSLGGWADQGGTMLDIETWLNPVISTNDEILRTSYNVEKIYGFRAPRLEVNDAGLKALVELDYLYDVNMEEGHQWEYVTAAVKPGTDESGFNWVVWPYTLDNGSPGAWQSQDFGEKDYLADFPRGIWEAPVYMVYVPDNGLQETIAERMKKEITSEPTDWIGDKIRDITAFDFNTFLYARLTKEEWLEIMKFNFLLRYNGNRAPLTFGAHPAEFSSRYDDEVIMQQAGNEDFQDVLNYNTYQDRKDAMKEFVTWVQSTYPDDVYILSGKELIDYMKKPWDKDHNDVEMDALASPTNNKFFDVMTSWVINKDDLGSDAEFTVVDKNTMDIEFTVGTPDEAGMKYCFVDVATYFEKGALTGVSHIDIVYESDAPFRVRLLPEKEDGDILAMQALVSGGPGGERMARIRVKDFRPDPYAAAERITSSGSVDDAYLSEIVGLAFENAATKDNLTYNVKIKRIVVHGLDSRRVKARPAPVGPHRFRGAQTRRPTQARGSSIFWPQRHERH